VKASELDLVGAAAAGAATLERQFPGISFTSGRRGLTAQARAMASNLLLNRRWIAETYKATPQSAQLQAAVLAHPDVRTLDEIADLLQDVMGPWADHERGSLSRHFAGLAFDIQPRSGSKGEAIKAATRALPGLDKFLEMEGGLIRWHAQFK
jgi:hypothetical protein